MKKYMFPVCLSLFLGVCMSLFLISRYENMGSIAVFSNAETVYYIQRGVYSSKENMLSSMNDFENYIYDTAFGKYYVYIGITKNKKNAEKLKGYYSEKGYDTYIKDKITSNTSFLKILDQYDKILSKTTDEKTISVICDQVLSKYEELINDEY